VLDVRGSILTTAQRTRDRFVALSFCWGEILLELDNHYHVLFAGGMCEVLFGKGCEDIIGRSFLELSGGAAAKVIRSAFSKAKANRQRIQDLYVSMERHDGRTQICQIAGYFAHDSSEDKGIFYLSLKLMPNAQIEQILGYNDGFLDADSFCDMANETLERRKNAKLSLISIPELQTLFGEMDRGEQRNVRLAISSFLHSQTLNNEDAGTMGIGKYAILHDENVSPESIRDQLSCLLASITSEENIKVLTSSIEGGDQLDPEDVAKGIVFAINQFKDNAGDDLTLTSLNANLADLAEEAVKTVSNFRNVVDKSKFNIIFQPIVSLKDGRLHHYEVLSRFQGLHGESPYRYICFAEETGLIASFDIAVINKTVDWLSKNRDQNPPSMAVNMSGQSLLDEKFRNQVDRILAESPWIKDYLILELTESSRVEDLQSADIYIQHLRTRGIPVCLDDFGAGAASFNYLSAMAVDVVKIDGAAITNTIGTKRGRAFMKAMASFCRELKVETIGEMIDGVEKLRFLQDCGIEYGQGYLFGKGGETPEIIPDTARKLILSHALP